MANGSPQKQDGCCEYRFLDGTYCQEELDKITITDYGKQSENNKLEDAKQHKLCIFHSHNDEKVEVFDKNIKAKIKEKNDLVIRAIQNINKNEFSGEDRKKREDIFRKEFLIDFEGFYFPQKADFKDENFRASISFIGVKFSDEVNFLNKVFEGDVSFHFAVFSKSACFKETKIKGVADFTYAKFEGIANFMSSKFGAEAIFKWVIFNKGALFLEAEFLKTLDFTQTAFLDGKLDFTKTVFPIEDTFFYNTVFNCEVFFYEQMLKGVRFTGCYLGSASFYGSDVRDAVFINSSWNKRFLEKQIKRLKKDKRIEESISVFDAGKKPHLTVRSTILFDEKLYLSSYKTNRVDQENGSESVISVLDPLYLEQLYCQFKLAMDKNKMYSLANDFYHGEKLMECRRLRQENSCLKLLFLRTYWFLSGFGNIPLLAIIWLAIFLYTSSLLLITTDGLKTDNLKMAFERCPCGKNESQQTIFDNRNITVPVYFTKPCAVFLSKIYKVLFSTVQIHKDPVLSLKIKNALNKTFIKNEENYSLKDQPWCNAFYVSLWNLTASPGRRSSDYKENGIWAYLAVFCIQYIFRPLMVALIIISVRRKVYRG